MHPHLCKSFLEIMFFISTEKWAKCTKSKNKVIKTKKMSSMLLTKANKTRKYSFKNFFSGQFHVFQPGLEQTVVYLPFWLSFLRLQRASLLVMHHHTWFMCWEWSPLGFMYVRQALCPQSHIPSPKTPLRGEGGRDGEAFSNALGGGGTCASL